jgi:HB1, ASXL, restriction endonuclease HTH domain
MSKKTTKTKARKALKRGAGQTPEPAGSGANTPVTSKLIPELAAMKLSPKLVAKLEALPEPDQETVLNYVNSGVRIDDAYKRVMDGKLGPVEPEPPGADAIGFSGQVTETITPTPAEADEATQGAAATTQSDASKPRRAPRAAKAKNETGPKKLSAIDAAAKVLTEAGGPMDCQTMIKTMAEKGYWSSPGGKTPAATLYSAILRELQTKGNDSRFKKTERGKFGVGKAS